MADPITVKKKKLTLMSPAVKKGPLPAAPEGADATSGDDSDAASLNEDAVVSAAPPAPPAAMPPSYMLAGICAILATLVFMVILLIQWFEYDFLSDAFPRPIPTAPVVAPAMPAE